MTVEELINELMASCQTLEDEVIVNGCGGVTRVSGEIPADGTHRVYLNNYPPVEAPETR